MGQPDSLAAGSVRYRVPVDKSERRRQQTADYAGRHHPKRDRRHQAAAPNQVDNVKNNRRSKQAERKNDQYRMYRVTKQFRSAFHILSPADGDNKSKLSCFRTKIGL